MSRRKGSQRNERSLDDLEDVDDIESSGSSHDEELAESALEELMSGDYVPDLGEDDDGDGGSYESEISAEHLHMQREFKVADSVVQSRIRNTRKAVGSGTDAHYYVVVAFVSEDQKLEFIQRAGWEPFGGNRFINGVRLAKSMGIKLTAGYMATDAKPDKSLMAYEAERKQTMKHLIVKAKADAKVQTTGGRRGKAGKKASKRGKKASKRGKKASKRGKKATSRRRGRR